MPNQRQHDRTDTDGNLAQVPEERHDEQENNRGAISFSIRLTDEQRELLTRAAKVRGWTLSNLIKTAAFERAAHILNTATPNRSVDFRDLARTIAKHLFAPRQAWIFDGVEVMDCQVVSDLVEGSSAPSGTPAVKVEPLPMESGSLSSLMDAWRYGGVEFLTLVLEACERELASRRTHLLPPPIDPAAV